MIRRDAALAAGGLAIGAALIARGLRARRALDLDGAVALITGGSRGLGLLLARELGRQGARVVLAARDAEELDRARTDLEATGVDAAVLVADVGAGAGADRVVEDVVAMHGRIDVLVNNAGIIRVGPVDHMSIADFDEAMAVHFWAPLRTMRAAIPHMRRQGGGRIVNISSIGGKIGVPHLVPYCASKFALTGLSTSMRPELLSDDIYITTVSPGMMRTGSPFNAWFKGQHREEFAWFAISGSIPWMSIGAERAARQIVDAARHGDAELVVSLPARLAVTAYGLAPAAMAFAMAAGNRLLPGVTDSRGATAHSGWQSGSKWAPSTLTKLTDDAAARNNELPPR
ncbi:MAG TPA: SDR family oxidoreductase [Vicinamibacterales bacterium]|nr:SDR family oxidoreductase [Vicinamibacterales bacterium]